MYGRLRPYPNKVLLPDFEGHCSTEVFSIKSNEELGKRFLFFWLTHTAILDMINAKCTGARMPRANMHDVLEFDFSYPPLPEQQRIVAKLEELSTETKKLEAIYQQKFAPRPISCFVIHVMKTKLPQPYVIAALYFYGYQALNQHQLISEQPKRFVRKSRVCG